MILSRYLVIGWLLAAFATPANAGPYDFVVYISRLGGDTETAKPYVTRFSALLEQAMGWPKGSCKGAFFAQRQAALSYIKQTSPGFALLDPSLYLELRRSASLVPIAQLTSQELVAGRMHIVVKDPALTTLAQLKGKRFWTTLADSPLYLSRVVLEGKVEATSHFALKRVGQALKGVRAVLRGQADATLLDDDQLAAARKMEGGDKLRTIYDSPALPPLPLVAVGQQLKPAEQKKLVQALLKLCASGEGAAVCKDMRLRGIAPAKRELFSAAEQRYEQSR